MKVEYRVNGKFHFYGDHPYIGDSFVSLDNLINAKLFLKDMQELLSKKGDGLVSDKWYDEVENCYKKYDIYYERWWSLPLELYGTITKFVETEEILDGKLTKDEIREQKLKRICK